MNKITLVDDDQNILASVSIALEAQGFAVETFHDGEAGLEGMRANPPDIAVLDIKMPRMDGLELLEKLRMETDVPVIFLTSKDDEEDEALGLRLGADDYIKKPFSQKLLIARIEALLRRQSILKETKEPPAESTPDLIVRGYLTLDESRHLCTWKETPVGLTITEYLLIKSLAEHPGHARSRDQLIDMAYGETIYVDDRTVDSHIKRLRKKFKDVDPEFNHIETLYGLGYRYKDGE